MSKFTKFISAIALALSTVVSAATDSALYAQLSTEAVEGIYQGKNNSVPILVAGFGITILFVLYSIMRRGANKAGGR